MLDLHKHPFCCSTATGLQHTGLLDAQPNDAAQLKLETDKTNELLQSAHQLHMNSNSSRFEGVQTLLSAKQHCKDRGQQALMASVLAVVQQELADTAVTSFKLREGIADSFEVLGHYMRGLPGLHHQHSQHAAAAGYKEGGTFIGKGPMLWQHPCMELAGGFMVPSADAYPGSMSPSEYTTHLAPKLLALQQLRLAPYGPYNTSKQGPGLTSTSSAHTVCSGGSSVTSGLSSAGTAAALREGLMQLRQLLAGGGWEPRLRLELEQALHHLTLVEQPAEWIYTTLKAAANTNCHVSYQLWMHSKDGVSANDNKATRDGSRISTSTNNHSSSASDPAQPHSSWSTNTGHNTSSSNTSTSIQCIANGPTACNFMWRSAPRSHAHPPPPGVHCIFTGPDCGHLGRRPAPRSRNKTALPPRPPRIPAPPPKPSVSSGHLSAAAPATTADKTEPATASDKGGAQLCPNSSSSKRPAAADKRRKGKPAKHKATEGISSSSGVSQQELVAAPAGSKVHTGGGSAAQGVERVKAAVTVTAASEEGVQLEGGDTELEPVTASQPVVAAARHSYAAAAAGAAASGCVRCASATVSTSTGAAIINSLSSYHSKPRRVSTSEASAAAAATASSGRRAGRRGRTQS